MKSEPTVSVIMSFFNAETFISEAIESVFWQTFSDWELLLVDDGSSDSSTRLAMQFAGHTPGKVQYLEHEHHGNRGAAASRNLGLDRAKARYVALLDADDIWFPEKLEQQVCLFETFPQAAMVYGHSQYWWGWTGRDEDRKRDRTPDLAVELDRVHYPPSLLRLYLSTKAPAPCPSDLIFCREAILALGGFEGEFEGMYGMYEDQAFLAKVFLNLPVFVASNCWDRYRQHANSVCAIQTRLGREPEIRLYYLNWLCRYLKEQHVEDTRIWRSLRRMLWPYRHPNLSRFLRPQLRLFKSLRRA